MKPVGNGKVVGSIPTREHETPCFVTPQSATFISVIQLAMPHIRLHTKNEKWKSLNRNEVSKSVCELNLNTRFTLPTLI